jgi:2,5-furandicarboxylate decarboxylase 1
VDKKTFRGWINYLETKGLLVRIKKKVIPMYQLGALTKKVDGQKAIFFEKVGDYKMPVVSNLCFSQDCFNWCAQTHSEDLIEFIRESIENPRPCSCLDSAPFMENVFHKNIDLLKELPAPTYHKYDAGAFITGGLVITKDVETGKRNVSIHRLQILGENILGVFMLPRHLQLCYQKAKALGRSLEVAIVIGVDPLTLLSSQAILAYGIDELEVANRMHGEQPLHLTKCLNVEIEVPVESEIVIEGKIQIDEKAMEGPFGEFPKYYSNPDLRPVIKVDSICHRNNPIYYSILPASREHLLLGGLAREASLLKSIRSCVPSVQQVHLTFGGTCRYHLVISIKKRHEGESKNAILAAMANNADIKHVIVVDHDVDIFNMEEVEWAIATRFQGHKDIFIISHALGSQLDPSSSKGIGTKIGIDATVPLGQLSTHFNRIRIPGYEDLNIEDFL